MAIFALAGRAGSGKDTVAQMVQELYPELNWQIKGFADKLRQVTSLLTGIPAKDMKKQEVKEQYLGDEWNMILPGGVEVRTTVRYFLQNLGTNAIRGSLNCNSWVNALMCDYKMNCDPFGSPVSEQMQEAWEAVIGELYYPNWLITDTRFPNELESITSRGGTCIRIVRPDNPYPQSHHESETALDGVELLTIINDGSLDQLRLRVKEVFDPIVKNLGNA